LPQGLSKAPPPRGAGDQGYALAGVVLSTPFFVAAALPLFDLTAVALGARVAFDTVLFLWAGGVCRSPTRRSPSRPSGFRFSARARLCPRNRWSQLRMLQGDRAWRPGHLARAARRREPRDTPNRSCASSNG